MSPATLRWSHEEAVAAGAVADGPAGPAVPRRHSALIVALVGLPVAGPTDQPLDDPLTAGTLQLPASQAPHLPLAGRMATRRAARNRSRTFTAR